MYTRTSKTINELSVGDSASLKKRFTDADIKKYADVSHDNNPLHLDEAVAAESIFGRRVVQGMLVSALISGTIGTRLPGDGTIYLEQSIRFVAPVFLGDTIKATVTVTKLVIEKNICILSTTCVNQDGKTVVEGNAVVMPRKES
jgi:acyl dehydratase